MWSTRTARVAALVVACLASAAFLVGFGERNAQRQITVKPGDYVRIPALGWGCIASVFRGQPLFTCTSDNKPVRDVTIWAHQIIVGGIGRPAPVHGGYRFRF